MLSAVYKNNILEKRTFLNEPNVSFRTIKAG